MRKFFLKIMLTLMLVISFSAIAIQADAASKNEGKENSATEPVSELNGNMYQYDELVTTYGWPWTAITKTITKEYSSAASVPESVYYTEYINDKWYSGTLKRTGEVQRLSHAWRATFTGKINY